MTALLFSPETVLKNRARARADDLPFRMFEAALVDRLSDIKIPRFDKALWIGGGDPAALTRTKDIGQLAVMGSGHRPAAVSGAHAIEGHEATLPFGAATLDLVVCNGTLQSVDDLPGALIQIRRALKPDGLFLCALAGGRTLSELRESLLRAETTLTGGAAARIHPMIDLQTFSALLQRAGFALPVADASVETFFYRKLRTLLRDIKASGEGYALAAPRRPANRGLWQAVEADYKNHHAAPDGLLKASFEVLYGIGWGPADSQPKPLKPGSAKHSLAEALGGQKT